MKHYIIKNEYWDNWGVENESMALVDMEEIKRLASEWDVEVNKLMEQVEEAESE